MYLPTPPSWPEVVVVFFNSSHSNGYEVVSGGFDWHFPNSDVQHLFIC